MAPTQLPSAGIKSPQPTTNANGFFSPPGSPSSFRLDSAKGARVRSGNFTSLLRQSQQAQAKNLVVRDTAFELKRKSASELGAGISDNLDKVSFIDLVEWIRSERLSALPHKGSKWDTVLIRSLYFAERLHAFEAVLKGHALDSDLAAQLGYGHVRLLLELGHGNSAALDRAFALFYRTSSKVSNLLSRSEVLDFSADIYEQLCIMYTDLLTLVVDVAVKFYRTVHSATGASATLDMYGVFGETIATFRHRTETITQLIWRQQIDKAGLALEEDVDVHDLARWLSPQDRVLDVLSLDHTVTANDLAEFTCVWFHDDLAEFVKSGDKTLLINGATGAGKTTLAASLAERLQRPIARKSLTTAFISVGAVESQATSLNVVKALLFQLLAIRVGNSALYRSVASAYISAKTTSDPAKYEDLLWHALDAVLKSPLEGSKDTVLLVEGVDEVLGGQPVGQALLQRLVQVVEQGKGVKLIALSENLSLPTGIKGQKRTIAREDTNDDIHGVVIQQLAHSHHFRSTTGREQETIARQIIESAQGSFLWATLAADLLRQEKTPETFTKTLTSLQTPRPSIDDLVFKLTTVLEPSPEAKLALSWLVYSARPLTFKEFESLYSVDVPTGTRSEKRFDVPRVLQSLAPLLTIQEDIVRLRHPLVKSAVHNLFKQGKITSPVKDQPLDVLLRLFTFAKFTLPENGEPTLSSSNRSPIDIFFGRNPTLEYVIRYWPWHLQQTSILVPGKPFEPKITPELQKAFPSSTTMPLLEWLAWDDQFPGAQEVEFHEIAGTLRSKILTERHPAVLQSYINAASYYEQINDVPRASSLYYSISTIGRTILSVSHPIVVETAIRFLQLTSTQVTTTRNEVVTLRERIYILLIESYERQFGIQSDIVIQTRELLAELYVQINEKSKAEEVLRVITGGETVDTTTGGIDGSGSLDEHFHVVFSKGKDGGDVKGYNRGIFVDDTKDDEATTIFDLARVELLQREVARYTAEKNFVQAEQTLVELWQRLSFATRTTSAIEWHQKKLDVMLSYSQFLESQKRQTESVSLLTSAWQEYAKHELSFNESIVSKLTQAARYLKSVGEYSVALSILKHSAAYAQNFRKEDARSVSELEEEITTVTTLAVASSSKHASTSSTASSSEHLNNFRSLTSSNKKIDSSTIATAKNLSTQFIERKEYAQAVEVIETTLQQTWSSFFSKNVNDVTLTTTFQKDSVELAEQLAIAYSQQNLVKQTEDVYIRLFRAALTAPKETALLEKSRTLLVSFYAKRGRPDKVVSIYQELLAVYRRTLGPNHETTIQALYDVALKCRANARSHPYWIEYYQQIVTILNKDTTTLHPRSLDAAIVVAESYWEDGRTSDAVTAYASIWNTFVQKWKEYKVFSDTTFVSTTYQRYYEALEETQATWEVLHAVTSQYRETTKAAFGATSAISIEATVALARVLKQSESHTEQAISLYEEASSHLSQSKSASSVSVSSEEMKQTLATLYTKHILRSKSSTASSESISRAVSVYQSQLEESKSRYGYSHQETLRSLRDVSELQIRQKQTEAVLKQLTQAAVEIVTKEQSSQKIHESATSLVQTYQACGLTQQAHEFASELHHQLITHEKSEKAAFNVTQSSKSSLYFLAVWEYQLRKDISITLTEILAALSSEYILFANFKQLVKTNAGIDKILVTAAPLYHLLRTWNRISLLQVVERDAVVSFTQHEASEVQLLNKDSPRHFIAGVLEYLGNRQITDVTRTVIFALNHKVAELLKAGLFLEAHDVAKLAFAYAHERKGYRGHSAIARGFSLALLLAGRGAPKSPDNGTRKQLLSVSNAIIKDILKTVREQKLNFAQVQLGELNELVSLLGDQEDYDTLGSLLGELWNTRDAQRNWPADVLLNLGRRLVCARYLAGHQIKAIRLCEDIAYNLRRVNGIRHPATLETYDLLAQLYNRTGKAYQREAGSDKAAASLAAENFKKAVFVHEDVLRWILNEVTGGISGDDDDTAAAILAEHGIHHDGDVAGAATDSAALGSLAKKHLLLLKYSHQRLGAWPKSYSNYERLNADLFSHFGEQLKGVEGVEKWQSKGFGAGKAESEDGVFAGASQWNIVAPIQA